MNPISGRTGDVFAFICDHIDEHGFAPTIREIGAAIGLASTNAVRFHLGKLEQDGWIKRERSTARTITVPAEKRVTFLGGRP